MAFPRASFSFSRIRYVLPRHWSTIWVGPGRSRKSTQPGANGVSSSRRLPRGRATHRDAVARAKRAHGLLVSLACVVTREAREFIVHGLVARGIGPVNVLLNRVEVLKQRRVEFEIAGSTS